MSQTSSQTNATHGQSLPAGTHLEEFVIERVLGVGGFGITYLAKDSSLGRQVVVKENLPAQFCWRDTQALTVRPRHTEGEDADNFSYSLESFRKEASTLASLDHPGIVKVLRSFQAHGTAYFVMPFVEGTALDEVIRQRTSKGNPFTEAEIQDLLTKVLDALSHLHDRGIYHRDIKPGNILMTKAGPVLIDFGAARQRLSERSLTVIESAGYTPFEQLQSHGKIGPWSDIYALGGTLYKTMTGETPAKANNRVFDDPIEPLAQREELRGLYAPALLASIDKAMSPKASDRFQDVGQWRQSVKSEPDRIVQETATQPPPTLHRAPPTPPPHPPEQDSGRVSLHAKHRQILTAAADAMARHDSHTACHLFKQLENKRFADLDYSPLKQYVVKRKERTLYLVVGAVVLTLIFGIGLIRNMSGTDQISQEEQRHLKDKAAQETAEPARLAKSNASAKIDESQVRLLAAKQDTPFTNSLGMKFVPADTPNLLFSVLETRVRDFKVFVESTGYDAVSETTKGVAPFTLETGAQWRQAGGSWKNPRFPTAQNDEHPVVCVSFLDAEAFCEWLTKREHATGVIPSSAAYRLPTDGEWGRACGTSDFPWGYNWPPGKMDGNYSGIELFIAELKGYEDELVKAGRSDGVARTAPVGIYKTNLFGLADMGGNVFEWCGTWYTTSLNDDEPKRFYPILSDDQGGETFRVLRGASWANSPRSILRTTTRLSGLPRLRDARTGFRCVLVIANN